MAASGIRDMKSLANRLAIGLLKNLHNARSYAVTTVSIAKQMHKPIDDTAHPVVSHLAQLFSGDRKQLCVASGPFRRLLSAADCATTNIDIAPCTCQYLRNM